MTAPDPLLSLGANYAQIKTERRGLALLAVSSNIEFIIFKGITVTEDLKSNLC
jgi:hypothetical protein